MAGGKGSKKKAEIADRQQRALQLRKTGASYRAIAVAIAQDSKYAVPKYCESQAYRDVAEVLQSIIETTQLDAEACRTLELEKLDMAQLAIANQVRTGDYKAIDRWLRISERRSKLLGLDAPDHVKITGEVERELERSLDILEQKLPVEVYNQVIAALSDDDIAADFDE